MKTKIIQWARKLQAVSQNGLLYAETSFHKERYQTISHIALEIFEEVSNFSKNELENLFLEQKGYATPKFDTRAVIVKNDKILFVREVDDNKWSLPGGWVEVGESPKECIEKEVLEECGYRVKATKLIGVYDKDTHALEPTSVFHVFSFFFLCEIIESTSIQKENTETDLHEFVSIDNIPVLSTTRISSWQVKRMYQLLKEPNHPTEFE